jgi:AraC-like DNA-binding protein
MEIRSEGCPEGRWQMLRAFPGPDLAGDVVRYAGFVDRTQRAFQEREIADVILPLIISFGPVFEIDMAGARAARTSFVAGLYGGYADVAWTGRTACVQVDFTPPGARRFFRLPLRELAGQTVALQELDDPGLRELACRLEEMPGWEARLRLLDRFVRRRLGAAPPLSPGVAHAWQRLVRSRGTTWIGALTAELEWSRKHLADRFRNEIGETPKTVARLLRFRAARIRIERAAVRPDWADLAADCGFADQPHLIREFRALAGVTPRAYADDLSGRFPGAAATR